MVAINAVIMWNFYAPYKTRFSFKCDDHYWTAVVVPCTSHVTDDVTTSRRDLAIISRDLVRRPKPCRWYLAAGVGTRTCSDVRSAIIRPILQCIQPMNGDFWTFNFHQLDYYSRRRRCCRQGVASDGRMCLVSDARIQIWMWDFTVVPSELFDPPAA